LPGTSITSLAIGASNTATIYAGTKAGVYKSIDAGSIWTAQNTGLTNNTVNGVVVDPTNSNTVYAATGSGSSGAASGAIFKSTNGGGSWTAVVSSAVKFYKC